MIGYRVNMMKLSPYHEEHDEYPANDARIGEHRIIGIGREVFTDFILDVTEQERVQKELAALNARLDQRIDQHTKELRNTQA